MIWIELIVLIRQRWNCLWPSDDLRIPSFGSGPKRNCVIHARSESVIFCNRRGEYQDIQVIVMNKNRHVFLRRWPPTQPYTVSTKKNGTREGSTASPYDRWRIIDTPQILHFINVSSAQTYYRENDGERIVLQTALGGTNNNANNNKNEKKTQ